MSGETSITQERSKESDIKFTGNVTYRTVDKNGDGIAEQLAADVEVEILTAGEYTVVGRLKKGGQMIANRPNFDSMLFSKAPLNGAPGLHSVSLTFSGEQIFQSGTDGPYDLALVAVGASSHAKVTVPTPAYSHTQFGEPVRR